jgi:5-methylcytosine-specific restriction endonuclease McrA
MRGHMRLCRKGLHELDEFAVPSPSTGRRICEPCYRTARLNGWRKYYIPHPRPPMTLERRREIRRNWQLRNPEAKRVYRAVTPELQRAQGQRQNARRRARLAGVPSTLTAKEWKTILAAAGHACIYCRHDGDLSMDHLIPIARGGPHTAENVAPACLPCNLSKHAQTEEEFLQTTT